MKLVFNIDNDEILAMLVLMQAEPGDRYKAKEFLKSHDQVEVPSDMLDGKGRDELRAAMTLIAVGCIGDSIG